MYYHTSAAARPLSSSVSPHARSCVGSQLGFLLLCGPHLTVAPLARRCALGSIVVRRNIVGASLSSQHLACLPCFRGKRLHSRSCRLRRSRRDSPWLQRKPGVLSCANSPLHHQHCRPTAASSSRIVAACGLTIRSSGPSRGSGGVLSYVDGRSAA